MRVHISYYFTRKKNLEKNNITNVFNIYPSSVPYQTVTRLLQVNAVRTTTKYLPARSLWIIKLFIELANNSEKVCLTIDCSGINKNGPGRFRTEANKPEKQISHFNAQNNDQIFNVFTSNRINQQKAEKAVLIFRLTELRVRQMQTHLEQIHYYGKMAQAKKTQKIRKRISIYKK